MAERLKAHAWKACVRASVPWVRIPLLPPTSPRVTLSADRHCAQSHRFEAGLATHLLTGLARQGQKTALRGPILSEAVDLTDLVWREKSRFHRRLRYTTSCRGSNGVRPAFRQRARNTRCTYQINAASAFEQWMGRNRPCRVCPSLRESIPRLGPQPVQVGIVWAERTRRGSLRGLPAPSKRRC